jgi:thiamine-phosphate pyrophosphorylase
MAIVPDADAGLRARVKGATVLQLRDPWASVRTLEREARRLIPTSTVPVIVSSRIDVALATKAYGVHLPERDISVADARKLLPKGVIGRSVHSVEAAQEAEDQGADYVVFGPVFPTISHSDATPVGLDALGEVAASVRIPVLAIGGVDLELEESCWKAGAAGFAAIAYFQAR